MCFPQIFPSGWLLLRPIDLSFLLSNNISDHYKTKTQFPWISCWDSSKIAFRRVETIMSGYFEVVNEHVGKNWEEMRWNLKGLW